MPEELKPYVITIVGPESSGKTTLATQLAQFIGCPWVPEYAREYLSGLNRAYIEEDLGLIAQGQLELISAFTGEDIPYCSLERFQRIYKDRTGVDQRKSFITFPRTDFGIDPRKVLIVDNGLLSIKMWAELKYGAVAPAVEQALEKDLTDLYLLCRPVYPWAPDPLREAPGLLDRAWIYNQFLKQLAIM